MAFASDKNAYGISDRSGFRYRLKEMRREWTGALVGPDEFEPKHPQLEPPKAGPDPQAGPDEFEPKHPQLEPPKAGPDPQALRNPRPDRKEPFKVFLLTDSVGLSIVSPRGVGRVGQVTALTGGGPSPNVNVVVSGVNSGGTSGTVSVVTNAAADTFDSTDETLDSTTSTFDEG